jgi:hypothetical protein
MTQPTSSDLIRSAREAFNIAIAEKNAKAHPPVAGCRVIIWSPVAATNSTEQTRKKYVGQNFSKPTQPPSIVEPRGRSPPMKPGASPKNSATGRASTLPKGF